MTLAARLLLAFGFVAVFASALVGVPVRGAAHAIIEDDFDQRIKAAAHGVGEELHWEADALNERLTQLCAHDTLFDKTHLALERVKGDTKALDPDLWMSLRFTVPEQAKADNLDDLALVAADGTVLGAGSDTGDAVAAGRVGARDPRLAALLKQPPAPRA